MLSKIKKLFRRKKTSSEGNTTFQFRRVDVTDCVFCDINEASQNTSIVQITHDSLDLFNVKVTPANYFHIKPKGKLQRLILKHIFKAK